MSIAESLLEGGVESLLHRTIFHIKDFDYDYKVAKKPWLKFVKKVQDSGKSAIFTDSNTWKGLGVRVKSGNWTIIMDLEKRKIRKRGRSCFYTLIRVPYKMKDKFRFDIAYKGWLESQYISFGWSKVKVAEDKFNLNYFVRGNNKSKLKTLVSDPIFQGIMVPGFTKILEKSKRYPPYFCFRTVQRGFLESQILDWFSKNHKNNYPSLKREVGELELMINRVIQDETQLQLYFGFIESCLECLVSMGCASPEAIDFSRGLPDKPRLIYPAESVQLISELGWFESRFGKKKEIALVKSDQFNTLIGDL